jgi:hypothetical protein
MASSGAVGPIVAGLPRFLWCRRLTGGAPRASDDAKPVSESAARDC